MADHSIACPLVKVENPAPDVWLAAGALLPLGWAEQLEQNQLLASCCRHPEGHSIEAYYSSKRDEELGIPDIYIFYCSCGAKHVKWCVSNPETAGVLVWGAPYLTSAAAETLRPIWPLGDEIEG